MAEAKLTEAPVSAPRRSPRWWRRAQLTARRANFYLWLEVLCAAALAIMLFTSWVSISRMGDPGELVPSAQAAAMLVGTLIPALGLIVLWGRRIAIRRAGDTTARLHVNLVFVFSLIAAIPTLFVAVFASVLFQSGVEFWFSDQQRGILENANELARGYYDENQREVGEEAAAMATDMRYLLQTMPITSPEFAEQYFLQAFSRNLSGSAILMEGEDGELRTLAITDPDADQWGTDSATAMVDELRETGQPIVVSATAKSTEAVITLDEDTGLYLQISKDSKAEALAQWERAQSVVTSYQALTERARVLQLRFNLWLFGVALALVSLAVWAALRFADRQVKPLAELVTAAREIGSGNYAMRVEGRTGPDEIGLLNRAFNRMSAQIESQTDALIGANRQLADRRAFIEAVLQSITAGIISIDWDGQVLLMNSSAQQLLLDKAGPTPVGKTLADFAPDIASLVQSEATSGLVQYSKDGELLTLAVKVAPSSEGHVITFEDITRQLLDQRQAAWSDVARRIAHEIKNPLTPIQLATERLKRRYGKQIEQDTELFDELTGTIIRQVGDLRKMVDEFSSFARLPKPVFRQEDAVDLVRQALFLQEVANPDIAYDLEVEGDIPVIECDRHQFGQAMTNVLKNAAEAVDARRRDAEPDYRGRVQVQVKADKSYLALTITDNGIGLPASQENIMEPYVTTREKGTGLGLAIVKKIVEEHGGELAFTPADEGGTVASMRFALHPGDMQTGSEAAE
ncbi:sensor histidine kinase [Alteraurantiacibacter aquimixticola]|uniref:histidine kinase n=1 Tax=Alteraurantiacibacter aquimixticola TaxID=2489173 RepID=A0A4T3EZI4_9SPHN|nr:ATP-binding protein [Alteraurantiacibacter aquimixticola]TIX50044.1 HAMP domain-containing protein [Alteraurantiacibacter aquimixticola]